jgi:hypothetical protein
VWITYQFLPVPSICFGINFRSFDYLLDIPETESDVGRAYDPGVGVAGVAGIDIGTETSPDAGTVIGIDVPSDAGTVTGTDVSPDDGTVTGTDVSPDAGTDIGADSEIAPLELIESFNTSVYPVLAA